MSGVCSARSVNGLEAFFYVPMLSNLLS